MFVCRHWGKWVGVSTQEKRFPELKTIKLTLNMVVLLRWYVLGCCLFPNLFSWMCHCGIQWQVVNDDFWRSENCWWQHPYHISMCSLIWALRSVRLVFTYASCSKTLSRRCLVAKFIPSKVHRSSSRKWESAERTGSSDEQSIWMKTERNERIYNNSSVVQIYGHLELVSNHICGGVQWS